MKLRDIQRHISSGKNEGQEREPNDFVEIL